MYACMHVCMYMVVNTQQETVNVNVYVYMYELCIHVHVCSFFVSERVFDACRYRQWKIPSGNCIRKCTNKNTFVSLYMHLYSLYMHTYSLCIHTYGLYIHTYSLYIHAHNRQRLLRQKVYNHKYICKSIYAYIHECMYVWTEAEVWDQKHIHRSKCICVYSCLYMCMIRF
jgi:hypothetical protein